MFSFLFLEQVEIKICDIDKRYFSEISKQTLLSIYRTFAGVSKKPFILLMFKTSHKEKLKTYAEVHGVSVKSNAEDIRVDDNGNYLFIHVDTAKAHIKWIAALKFAITGSMYNVLNVPYAQ